MGDGDNKVVITIGLILLGGWLILLYITAGMGALSGLLIGAAAGGLGAVGFPLFGSAYKERAKSFGPLPWIAYFFTRNVVSDRYRSSRVGLKR
jgi:hypothetical protein